MAEPALPAAIAITQGFLIPQVSIVSGVLGAPPLGVPPYPLSSDPSQTWYLTFVAGQLVWVRTPDAPGNPLFALQDAEGFFLLEDGAGALLMEA